MLCKLPRLWKTEIFKCPIPKTTELCNTPENKTRVKFPSPENCKKKVKCSIPQPFPGKLWVPTVQEHTSQISVDAVAAYHNFFGPLPEIASSLCWKQKQSCARIYASQYLPCFSDADILQNYEKL